MNEGSNGEVGELFKVTFDDVGFWNDVEISNAGPLNPHTVGATSLPVGTEGTEMVMDIHDAMDVEGAYADLTPYYGETPAATPEPASLTLFCTGLAAGLIRKRLARKKA